MRVATTLNLIVLATTYNDIYTTLIFLFAETEENSIALVPLNATQSKANNLHHSHQHIFQHQSSVTSTTSVQTVFHQSAQQTNGDSNSNSSNSTNDSSLNSAGQMLLLGNASNTTASLANGNSGVSINGNSVHGIQSSSRPIQMGNNNLMANGGVDTMQPQQLSHSSTVSMAEEALNIGDVADLLHPQYTIITGGRSREGCPLITFPDHNNFHLLSEHDYEKLISYITSVPP